jgi:hypothetical protein
MKYKDHDIVHDVEGNCIFHSKDIEWKKENKFGELLLKIAQHEIGKNSVRNVEFESAVFDSSINELLTLDFKNKILHLDNCEVISKVSIKNHHYQNAVSFKNTSIHGDISFSDASFNGVDFSETTVHGDFYLTRVTSKSYFYLDDSKIDGGLIFYNNVFNHVFSLNGAKVNIDPGRLRHSHFSTCIFQNQTDFVGTHFKKAFVFNECTINDRVYFDNTLFECDAYSPIFGAVHFSHNTISNSGVLKFIGKEDAKLFDQAVEVVFDNNQIEGEALFENCNLQRIADNYRTKLVDDSRKPGSKILIGKGCLKYRNQSPIRLVSVNTDNQNLVIDLCNTFSKFFSRSNGYNLGLEITERTSAHIKYFYFSDEPIDYEAFISNLSESEINMWSLVRIDKQAISGQYQHNNSLSDKVITTTDTIIDLAGVILKILARIPLLRLSSDEVNNLLNSAHSSGNKVIDNSSISVINVQQTVLLGIGNVQSAKL